MMGGWPLAATGLAIALLLWTILRWKLHPFFALLAAAIVLGWLSGMGAPAILASTQKGTADLLGSIALLLGAGVVLGRMIEVSGGGEALARGLIRAFGTHRIPWALLLAGYLVGIPVFFDAAFVTLVPLVWSITRETKRSLLLFAIPLLSALTATHGLIPPHPGPAAAAQLLGADMGRTILYGLVLAVPMSIVGGIVWGGWIGRRIYVPCSAAPCSPGEGARNSGIGATLALVLLPVVLIGGAAYAPAWPWLKFTGSPQIAVLITALLAVVLLGARSGLGADALLRHTGDALNSIGSLLLIIGASGAFKQVIVDSGAGARFAQAVAGTHASPLLMAYLVGAALRITLGSATASILTAAGIVAPMAASFPGVDRALLVMAVACGGSILSHVNDSGFWLIKEYSGMTVGQTLRSYSVMKLVTSLTGLGGLFVLQLLV